MRTNDPLDRDPRFYVRRRRASDESYPVGTQGVSAMMVKSVGVVELGGIGPPKK